MTDGGELRPDPIDAARVRQFYGRYAGLYDRLSRWFPGVSRFRRRVVGSLNLGPGDTVIEVGCGTGANFPALRTAIGDRGTVIGIDLTPDMVAIARRRIARRGWENVHVCLGDATTPPVSQVDGVLATFVVGMLPDPARAVDAWLSEVDRSGRVALLDAAPSRGVGAPCNVAFRAIARVGSPPGSASRHDASPATVLARRVGAAHDRLADRSVGATVDRPVLGFVWLTAGGPPS